MHSLPLYILLSIHIISFVIGFGSVFTVDMFTFLWISKRIKLSLLKQVIASTKRNIWIGWFALILSGTGLLILKGSTDSLTSIKLFFVVMLGINGIYLHFIYKNLASIENLDEFSLAFRARIALNSFISQLGWWAAFSIGFISSRINYAINTPANPLLTIISISLIILTAIIFGETVITSKELRKAKKRA